MGLDRLSTAACVAALTLSALAARPASAQTTYDLRADWSDFANPNEVWSYRAGDLPLPHVSSWQSSLGGWASPQPAWSYSENGTNRLPVWFQSNGSETFEHDWGAGAIVVHTTDDDNGIGNGSANVVWTSPFAGTATVSGSVWMGRDIGRSNDWFLFHNGTLLTSGSIGSGDPYSSVFPFDLAAGSGGASVLQSIAVSPGDTIRLEMDRTSSAGDFVVVNLTVQATPTPTDTTPPALALPADITQEATSAAGAPVSFSVSATDAVDGPVPVSCHRLNPDMTLGPAVASGDAFPLGTTVVECTASDSAGNTASGTFRVIVQDTTPPVLSLPGDIAATATSSSGAVVSFTAAAADGVSGSVPVSSTPASGSVFPLGTTAVQCTATDGAGNTASQSFSVTVAYAWSGVLPPVNANGSSIFKLGRTVPVKFQLTGASAGVTDADARLYVAKISNGVLGTEQEADSTAAATDGNLFRYDAASGQYIFNLGTDGLTTGTYQLRIDLGDGVPHLVQISLR